jgi:hypothetical protein
VVVLTAGLWKVPFAPTGLSVALRVEPTLLAASQLVPLKSSKVTVPPEGLTRPERVAVSAIVSPTVAVVVALVTRPGVALPTSGY